MKYLLLTLSVILSFALNAQQKAIKVTGGKISGITNSDGDIRIYKGIPFAAPPIGDLRWKAPQAVQQWKGVKSCGQFGPSPMQSPPQPFMFWSSPFLIPEKPISEDCLYLNVWTGAESKKEKRPVLVYIYGGGFRSGGSGCPIYDGEAMAKKGVVFVSINYRVGVFGFMAHPELSQEASYQRSGNYGILDMIAALEWVQKNIATFGGDPNNVTIAGQSAGAFGVNFLTASPLAKGLFRRAIAQSGGSFYTGLRPATDQATAEQSGIDFAKSLNCTSIAELRAKPASEIQSAQGGLSWPYVDGYVLPLSIYDIYDKGQQNDVSLMVGWNGDDRLFLQPMKAVDFQARMRERFGDMADDFFKVYPANSDEESAQSQSDMSRDETFGIQVYTWAQMQSRTGDRPAYIYNFNRDLPGHTPETEFGAFHSGEIVYAYDNLHTLDRPFEAVDEKIADVMSAYWVNFAKNGDPNGGQLPRWDPYTTGVESIMIIDKVIESKPLPDKDKMRFWQKYFSAQMQK